MMPVAMAVSEASERSRANAGAAPVTGINSHTPPEAGQFAELSSGGVPLFGVVGTATGAGCCCVGFVWTGAGVVTVCACGGTSAGRVSEVANAAVERGVLVGATSAPDSRRTSCLAFHESEFRCGVSGAEWLKHIDES